MTDFLFQEPLTEHHNYPHGLLIPEDILIEIPPPILFRNKKEKICVEIKTDRTLHTIYYIGVDWITKDKAVYVEPKLNQNTLQTDYLKMLFLTFSHSETLKHTVDLFHIKFNAPQVEINQKQDILTPLLAIQYLSLVKEIVKKGLKKSYYRVETNLNSRIKGKVLVSKTIKENLLKNRLLKTYCSYDEFGVNGFENRLLKKALTFVQRYLPIFFKNIDSTKSNKPEPNKQKNFLAEIYNYINPAFINVSNEFNINELKQPKKNIFYKEYEEAIKLAKYILKRFGYNITNTEKELVKTPPFWIDMSKLFELYVLGLLKNRFGNDVRYHYYKIGNELDFLLNSPDYKMVIDAKYKTIYKDGLRNEDMRQVSGYARLQSVYKELGKKIYNEIIDCLIIYPDQMNGNENLENVKLDEKEVDHFVRIYKVGIKLPEINS